MPDEPKMQPEPAFENNSFRRDKYEDILNNPEANAMADALATFQRNQFCE